MMEMGKLERMDTTIYIFTKIKNVNLNLHEKPY